MAITIHEGWYINNAGTGNTWTTSLLEKNTSNLPENKQNKHCSGVPDVMWKANWDWSSGSSSTAQVLTRAICNRANNIYDYSFCWSGLGYESYISRLQYVCYGNVITGKDNKPTIYQDNHTNTPWSFDYDYGWNRNNQNTLGRTWSYEIWQNNKSQYGYNYTWKNNTNTTNPNNNSQYWNEYYFCDRGPIQAIAPNNWINLICVIAKKSLNVTVGSYSSNVGAWDLYTYAKTNIHETYPYIIGVFIVPFAENNDSVNKREMFFDGDTNRYVRLSLSTYNEPAINGKLLYTSSNDTQNIAFSTMWHNSVISRPNFQGSFDNWTGYFTGNFRFKGNDNVVHSTYCAVPIMGAIFTGAQSTDLMQNGIFAYKNELFLQLRLGDEKWLEEYGHYTTAYGYEYDGVCYYREFDEDFYEECMRQTACFGLLFTDRYSVAYEGDVDDRYMFLGILDEDNIGHGNYVNGYDNLDQPQLNWTNTTDSTYDPTYHPEPPMPDAYSGVVTKIPKEGISRGGKWYILNGTDYGTHFNEFLNDVSTSQAEIYQLEPIQCVISSKVVMCPDFFGIPTSVDTGRIILGTHAFPETGVYSSVYAFANCYPETYISETKRVLELYNDFRDYEPYTKVSIYLPFAGNIEIPTNMVMNRHVHYEETIDPISGDLRYVIYIDGVPFTSVTGNCSFDLDINGEQSSLYRQSQLTLQHQRQDNQYNTLKSVAGNVVGASIAAKLKNPLGSKAQYVSGGISLAQGYFTDKYIEAQLDHSEPQPIQMAKTTSNCEYGDIILPCIAITRPRMVDGYNNDYFRKTNGFKTFTYSTVGQQKYFVQCSNVHMSGLNCTTEESAMIKKLLESGIYIKEE